VNSARLVERIRAAGFAAAEYAPDATTLLERLAATVQPGDLVLTLGAGNVWQLGEQFLQLLRERGGCIPTAPATVKAR
jgi:UDP-N-acetylmuramate--alanine ligase